MHRKTQLSFQCSDGVKESSLSELKIDLNSFYHDCFSKYNINNFSHKAWLTEMHVESNNSMLTNYNLSEYRFVQHKN